MRRIRVLAMSILLMLVLAACSGQSAENDTSSEMSTQDDISQDDTSQESQEDREDQEDQEIEEIQETQDTEATQETQDTQDTQDTQEDVEVDADIPSEETQKSLESVEPEANEESTPVDEPETEVESELEPETEAQAQAEPEGADATDVIAESVPDNQEQEELPSHEAETIQEESEDTNMLVLTIGDTQLKATLVENSSTAALKEMIQEGPVVIDMRDYGNMEKVGGIGKSLPTNNEQITTEAGDLILYQGNALVIYYDTNSWNFTRLGKIQGVTASELKEILGNGNVTVTLTLE